MRFVIFGYDSDKALSLLVDGLWFALIYYPLELKVKILHKSMTAL